MASVTRQATSDLSNTGGFTTSPLFSKINDASDSTLITGVTQGGGRATFGFTAFALTSSDVVSSVDIHYRHRSTTTSSTYNHSSCIKEGSAYYGMGQILSSWDDGVVGGVGSGSAIADRVYQGTLNPTTGIAWTYTEVNALTEFGVCSNDFNPDANFYQVDITVNYTNVSVVGDTVQSVWHTKQALGDTSQSIWHTRYAIGDTNQYIYNIRVAIFDTSQYIWKVATTVGQTSQSIWKVGAVIGRTVQSIWNVLVSATAVGDTVQIIWHVSSTVGKSSQKIWNVSAALGDNIQAVWNTRFALGDTSQYIWNIKTTVSNTLQSVMLVLYFRRQT